MIFSSTLVLTLNCVGGSRCFRRSSLKEFDVVPARYVSFPDVELELDVGVQHPDLAG